jgi:Flp pilus assembly protein TadD
LVRVQARLAAAQGVNTDLEIALFEADRGNPAAALRAARAEWERRRSVHVADALAWALHANGRDAEASRYARRALSLGTPDGTFLYHAGVIALALGRRAEGERLLERALSVDPYFSVLGARDARRLLGDLRAPS